jgi:hypothetical protein
MRGVNFTDINGRMNEIWPWVCALDAFDYADPMPLAELLRGDQEIPTELRSALANIITGDRTQNRKAASKLKIPASERMKIAGSISFVLGLYGELKTEKIYDEYGKLRRAIDIGADRKSMESIKQLRSLEAKGRKAVKGAAEQLGVSTETIENLLRDLRKKIRNFPEL